MLDFRVETFLEVCREMNFTKAAQRMNLTQPAVSQHIRWLEEEFGTKLFLYQGKKLMLTPAGELLRRSAATMKHDVSCLREKMQESAQSRRELKIGLTLTVAEFEAGKSIGAYLVQDGMESMRISVGNTRELLRELEEGVIDCALVEGNFPGEVYHHQLYATERYIPVCGARHPMASGRHTLDRLLACRLVTREPGSGTRNILERYLEMKNHEVSDFSALIEAGSIGLIKQLVEYGCGITFLYEAAVKSEILAGRLCEIHVEDMDITHDFTFIWLKNSLFFEDYQKMYELLRQTRSGAKQEKMEESR